MQAGGALQGGASTIPGRRRLKVLLAILAIVVIAALVALLVRPTPLAGSGAGAEEAGAGSAVIHDDAGNVRRNAGSGVMWAVPIASSGVGAEDAKSNAGAGSAITHDDAGNVHPD